MVFGHKTDMKTALILRVAILIKKNPEKKFTELE